MQPTSSFDKVPTDTEVTAPSSSKTVEIIEVEPRFNQIREDLASMFTVYIENEEMLVNRFVKDELYSKVVEDLKLFHHFALDYMIEEKLYPDGDPLLTREDFIRRGIRTLQKYGADILSRSKEPARSRIKELFIRAGMFTQPEIEQTMHSLRNIH